MAHLTCVLEGEENKREDTLSGDGSLWFKGEGCGNRGICVFTEALTDEPA